VWLCYVDDVFVAWLHGPEQLKNFLSHLNSLRPAMQFAIDMESNSVILVLDVLVIWKETTLVIKVYRKPTHTGRYFNLNSNYLPHVKRDLIQSLHKRASTICQESYELHNKISSLRHDLQPNGYP
jgi:hypothetical protein